MKINLGIPKPTVPESRSKLQAIKFLRDALGRTVSLLECKWIAEHVVLRMCPEYTVTEYYEEVKRGVLYDSLKNGDNFAVLDGEYVKIYVKGVEDDCQFYPNDRVFKVKW